MGCQETDVTHHPTLHAILNKPVSELVRQVSEAMRDDPFKGDWVNLIKKDLECIGMKPDCDVEILMMSKEEF